MPRIKVYTASDAQGAASSQTAQVVPAGVQGALLTQYEFTLLGADGDAIDLTGGVITGTKKLLTKNAITALDGTLAIDSATAGEFSWTMGSGDVGLADESRGFEVQFKITIGGSYYLTYPIRWKVVEAHGAAAVAAGSLTGVSPAESALLALLITISSATNNQVFQADGLGGGAWETEYVTKSIIVESPSSSEDLTFFDTDVAITIVEMRAVLANGSSTPSVTWTVRHATDRSAAGNEVVTGGTTTTATTTPDQITSFNDATIVADSVVWLETTAQSGTVPELWVQVRFSED